MKNLTTNTSLTLPPNGLLSVAADSVVCLRIEYGLVWITIEDDTHDYWLSSGESVMIPPLKLVVMEADSQVSQIQVSLSLDSRLTEQMSLAHQSVPLVWSTQTESVATRSTTCTDDAIAPEAIYDSR